MTIPCYDPTTTGKEGIIYMMKVKITCDSTCNLNSELHPFGEVIETAAGSTISCHCGPCCLGVLFFRK